MRRGRSLSPMASWLAAVFVTVAALGAAGCGDKKAQFGDKKEDWTKTTPPPQWRGPGQPGGPPAAALSGPATQPPAAVTGQAAPPGPGGSK